MPNEINSQNSEIFQQLSEQEQEIASGGCSQNAPLGMLLYQQTDIMSYANSETKFSDGDSEFSNSQTSLYSLSEKTFLFIPFFGSGRSRKKMARSFNNILFRLLGL
ncbi:MAG: hypothetical protein EAZ77_10475 [Nostocales cyanobacterium]|nr:MAG: hypothetical protein EAZ77_10475 [Nostocales cyanobacterium]